MKVAFVAAAVLAALSIGGCTQSPSSALSNQPDIGITQAVLDAYTNGYLETHTPEAMAVSENGRTSYYFYCEAARCLNTNLNSAGAIRQAISGCSERGEGPCVLFAVGRSAPRKYHLIDTFGQRLKSP